MFKVAQFSRWIVVVNGPKLVDELRKHPDELSFEEGTEEVRSSAYYLVAPPVILLCWQFLQLKHTLTRESIDDPYHVEIIREKLMRSLAVVLPNVIDELAVAVQDCIPINGNGTRFSQPAALL